MPATTDTKKRPAAPKAPKAPKTKMSLDEVMREMEAAGSEQTRKTYRRHGAADPMFGTSFATLKTLMKRIGVDHELALALWDTGNFDAQNLAVKIVDPDQVTSEVLDQWAREGSAARLSGGFAGMLAGESPHGKAKAAEWLASKDDKIRCAGWATLGYLAYRDETLPDAYFADLLAHIARAIHDAPNGERDIMNQTVIVIGCRNAALRDLALAASKRIGKVVVDYGDTACKTSDAKEYIEKAWGHSTSKGFESPAAHERTREVPRRRC
jgi:3-methyladenine DNA glycosylase AlkD